MLSRGCSTSPTPSSGGEVVPPRDVVRHDEDDLPRRRRRQGTRPFSDVRGDLRGIRLLARRRLRLPTRAGTTTWELGITAQRLGLDKQHSASSARTSAHRLQRPGIGDMSGGVFGNGMLLSRHIRRRRLRSPPRLPRPIPTPRRASPAGAALLGSSSGADYDGLISPGAASTARTAKTIELAPEVRAALGVEVASC